MGHLAKQKYERIPLALMKKRFCFLQEKVLSFGPNRTVEVRSNSAAEPNVWLVTSRSESMEKKALDNAGQAYHYTNPGRVEAR